MMSDSNDGMSNAERRVVETYERLLQRAPVPEVAAMLTVAVALGEVDHGPFDVKIVNPAAIRRG